MNDRQISPGLRRLSAVIAIVALAIGGAKVTDDRTVAGSGFSPVQTAAADPTGPTGPGGGGMTGPPGGGSEFQPPGMPSMPDYQGSNQPPLDQNNGISIYNSGVQGAPQQPSQAGSPQQGLQPGQNADGSWSRAANGEQNPPNYSTAPAYTGIQSVPNTAPPQQNSPQQGQQNGPSQQPRAGEQNGPSQQPNQVPTQAQEPDQSDQQDQTLRQCLDNAQSMGISREQMLAAILQGAGAAGGLLSGPGRDVPGSFECPCTTPEQAGPQKDNPTNVTDVTTVETTPTEDNSSQRKCEVQFFNANYDLSGLLKAVFPDISEETLRNATIPMALFFMKYRINTVARISAFIAEARVETGPGMAWLSEGDQVFDPGSQKEQDYYNEAYAGVNGNGDIASGDGFNYRGHGIIQLTGKKLYAMLGEALSPLWEKGTINPDTFLMGPNGYNGPGFLAVNDPLHMAISVQSGIWYYTDGFAGDDEEGPQYINRGHSNGNFLADRIQSDEDWEHFDKVSEMVNGGNSGQQERRDAFKTAYDYLSNKDHGCR